MVAESRNSSFRSTINCYLWPSFLFMCLSFYSRFSDLVSALSSANRVWVHPEIFKLTCASPIKAFFHLVCHLSSSFAGFLWWSLFAVIRFRFFCRISPHIMNLFSFLCKNVELSTELWYEDIKLTLGRRHSLHISERNLKRFLSADLNEKICFICCYSN